MILTERQYWVFAVGPVFVLFLIYLYFPLNTGPIEPDTATYLEFLPYRSSGYPAFLTLMGIFDLSPMAISRVQLAIHLLVSLFFLREVFRTTGTVLPAAVIGIVIWAAVPAATYHYRLLTESLFMSVQLAAATFMLRGLRDNRPLDFFLTALMLGLGFATRPSAIALLPLLLVLLAAAWPKLQGKRRLTTGLVVLGLAVTVVGERAYYQAVHGDQARTSLLGMHLYARAAVINREHRWTADDTRSLNPIEKILLQALEDDLTPMREFIWRQEDPDVRNDFLSNYEVIIQYRYMKDLRETLYASGHCSSKHCANVLMKPALMRLAAFPGGYLAASGTHFFDLWSARTVSGQVSPAAAEKIADAVELNNPLPLAGEDSRSLDRPRRAHALIPVIEASVRVIGIVLLVTAIWGLITIVRQRDRSIYLMMASILALGVHGSVLFSALFSIAERRYLVGLWPLMATSLFFLALYLWTSWRGPLTDLDHRRGSIAT